MKTAKEIVSEYPSCFPDGFAGELMSVEDAVKAVDSVLPKWVNIKESGNPEKKINCFFYSDDLRNPCDMVSGIYFPDERGFMSAGHKWKNVTHWMTLPKRPTA